MMRVLNLIGALLAAALITATKPAHADFYHECTNQTTYDAINCLGNALARSDGALATRRNNILTVLSDEPQVADAFKATETAWAEMRTKFCDGLVAVMYEGGKIQGPHMLACKYHLTREHDEFLGELFYLRLQRLSLHPK